MQLPQYNTGVTTSLTGGGRCDPGVGLVLNWVRETWDLFILLRTTTTILSLPHHEFGSGPGALSMNQSLFGSAINQDPVRNFSHPPFLSQLPSYLVYSRVAARMGGSEPTISITWIRTAPLPFSSYTNTTHRTNTVPIATYLWPFDSFSSDPGPGIRLPAHTRSAAVLAVRQGYHGYI
jgi:hypothetical protein